MLASAMEETAAMPMPALAVSAASAASLLRRKYWPTIRAPLSRTRATPRAEISHGKLFAQNNRNELKQILVHLRHIISKATAVHFWLKI